MVAAMLLLRVRFYCTSAVICATVEAAHSAAAMADMQEAKCACSQLVFCAILFLQFGVALEGHVLFTLTVL